MANYVEVAPEIIEDFKNLDTSSISDALDRLGISGGLLGIGPICSNSRLCGTAFTVHYVPVGTERGTVGDFIDDVKPGQVCVLDNGGRLDCTVWGDLMTLYAVEHGIAGTVIDGVCRDIDGIKAFHYPIFSKGHFMVTGKDRVWANEVNVPVSIGGQQVKAGDVIVGDASGVVCVPAEFAADILKVAKEIEAKEQIIASYIRKGMPLREARRATNYHHLQTTTKSAD